MDLKLEAIDTKIENYYSSIQKELSEHGESHSAIYTKLDDVHGEVKRTNGKVKKIIIALVAIGAFALGTGLQNITTLIKLIV